jgi:hypothetical protein
MTTVTVRYQAVDLGLNFPGNTYLLNQMNAVSGNVALTGDTPTFYTGEEATLDGLQVRMLGSGFAQPGVEILGLIVPTGTAVDVMVMQDIATGRYYFVYPDGAPNLLSAIALVVDTDPVAYSVAIKGPACLCDGALVATPDGPRPVEELRAGDLVLAEGLGATPILWILRQVLDHPHARDRPVEFGAGALGAGLPRRTLALSPQHRLAVPACPGHLAPAVAFCGLPGVRRRAPDGRPLAYSHLVLGRHALIEVEGVAAETLLVAPGSAAALGPERLASLAAALGVPVDSLLAHPAAMPCLPLLSRRQAARVIHRS